MRRTLATLADFVGRAALRVPKPLRHRLIGPTVELDGRELDRDVQYLLMLTKLAEQRPLHELPPPRARRQYLRMKVFDARPEPLHEIRDLSMPGPAGPMRLRVYVPRAAIGPLPVTVYLHGGGFVIGDLDTHDAVCRRLARRADCIVVAVDYRLAPESPFPAAVDDALAALVWVSARAGELGADADRIAVAGDSAGGNLSAAVCWLARNGAGPSVRLQALLYPATDLAANTASLALFAEGFFLTRAMRAWFEHNYCGGADLSDPRLSPLRCEDLAGLPPAYIQVAGFDILRDEGIAYAKKLEQAGVAVALVEYPGLIHGYVQMTGSVPAARHALDDAAAALRRALWQDEADESTSKAGPRAAHHAA